MAEEQAEIQNTRRHLASIWIVPLAAVVLGVWLAVNAYLSQGPLIVVEFANAEGIEADKTRVKARSVNVGVVTEVDLKEDLTGVLVTVELVPEAKRLLREDSEFWVVRPRVSGAGISGLGTLLSGAYIEIAPGVGEVVDERSFTGLEKIPATASGTPGLRLHLLSQTSGSVAVGSRILFRGYEVGRVESVALDVNTQELSYSVFIDAPYDDLVSSNTRFWNVSGVTAELGADGFKLRIGSLQSAISGGVAFDLPEGLSAGSAPQANSVYRLFPDEASIHENPHRYFVRYVASFKQSVRGLNPGAPVRYRGIHIGSVERILLRELEDVESRVGSGIALPVLFRVEPGRMEIGDTPEAVELAREAVRAGVRNGLRATLETGNLLTGALFVSLDYHDGLEEAELGSFLEYPAIPTIETGFGRIQAQITSLLDKLNQLPLNETMEGARAAIEELKVSIAAVRKLLESDATQRIPEALNETMSQLNELMATFSEDSTFQGELLQTIDELNRTLRSVRGLTDQLEDNPNSIIFPTRHADDPTPEAQP